MNCKTRLFFLSALLLTLNHTLFSMNSNVLETLEPRIRQATAEFDQIPMDRRQELELIAEFVRSKLSRKDPAALTFICTHNSRRSHMAQVWAQTAADYYGVSNVVTYSGGTETTACNPRTIRALRRAGFSVTTVNPGDSNPVYLIQYREDAPPLRAYSKVYDADGNPKDGFAAVMTCSDADQGCPYVAGAELRAVTPYLDPKVADGTDAEAATYDARCHQIAREMFYLMSRVQA